MLDYRPNDVAVVLNPDMEAVEEHGIASMAEAMELARQNVRSVLDDDPDPYGYAQELEEQYGVDLITPNWKAKPSDDRWHKRFKARARKAAVARLFLMGNSVAEIAQRTNVSETTVHTDLQAISREWRKSSMEDIEALAAKDLALLNMLLAKLMPGIDKGDTKSINSAIEIVKERAQIMGYRQGMQVDIEQYLMEVAESQGLDPHLAVQVAQRIKVTMK